MTKFLLIAAAALSGTVLSASTFTLVGVDTNRGANVSFLNNGVPEQGFAGVILGTFNGTDVSPLFCVDLFTDIGYGIYGSDPFTPRTIRHEDRAAWLYLNQLSTVVSQDTGLAFQLAIWDIIHDNGDGLAAGSVSNTTFTGLTQTQINLATTYISLSAGHSTLTGVSIYRNYNLTTGAPAQNLIGVAAPGGNLTNPEPASIGLIAFGAILVGVGRIRRRGV